MSAVPSAVPMKVPRLVSLTLAWAWGVVAGSTGLNALIKSNQEKARLKHHVPPPTVLIINIKDIFHPGVIATALSAFISVLCSSYVILLLLPRFNIGPTPLSTRTLGLQAYSLTFSVLWLFAVQIPFMQVYRTHSAQVHAFVGGVELPSELVHKVEKTLGATSVYKKISYLKLTAIMPWFTIFFTVIAIIVTFMAKSRAQRSPAASVSTVGEKEQPKASHEEHV
jgi:hypothetical protein